MQVLLIYDGLHFMLNWQHLEMLSVIGSKLNVKYSCICSKFDIEQVSAFGNDGQETVISTCPQVLFCFSDPCTNSSRLFIF